MIWALTASATAAAGAAAGVVAGLVLRTEVVRLSVPSGQPEQAVCAACATTLPDRPAWQCRHCGSWIGVPLAIELTTAAVVALLLTELGTGPGVAALVYIGVIGVALAQIDLTVKRLPDRLTLPAYPALITLLAVAAAVDGDWTSLVRAGLGGLAAVAAYLLLGVVSRGQLGGGDIKLAGLIGLALGWLNWRTLLLGEFTGFSLAAVASIGLLAARKISMRGRISFGPFLLLGALLAALATGVSTG
jgi:leader peptidase (prepilin peptidase)/N-methyltransferase